MNGVTNLKKLKKVTFDIQPPKLYPRGKQRPEWEWERKLKKAEARHSAPDIVKSIILGACSYLQPKMSNEITRDVLDEYGSLSHRGVVRYISELVAEGKLARVKHAIDDDFIAYVLVRPKLHAEIKHGSANSL